MRGAGFFQDTATVYNRYVDADGRERWKRTVLSDVCWQSAVGERSGGVTDQQPIRSGCVTVIIPSQTRAGEYYRTPRFWQKLADKGETWSLQCGDTLVKGAVQVEIDRSPVRLLSGLDGVYTITAVADHSVCGGMAHWEVTGA